MSILLKRSDQLIRKGMCIKTKGKATDTRRYHSLLSWGRACNPVGRLYAKGDRGQSQKGQEHVQTPPKSMGTGQLQPLAAMQWVFVVTYLLLTLVCKASKGGVKYITNIPK